MAQFASLIVERVEEVASSLQDKLRISKEKDTGSYTVGYKAPWAIYVHEDLEARHPNGGQAKFLEQPAREMTDDLLRTIKAGVRGEIGLKLGLRNAAIQLLTASQELVPVDMETLRKSGYVAEENGTVVFGSEETPDEIKAWQQFLRLQQRWQDQFRKNLA